MFDKLNRKTELESGGTYEGHVYSEFAGEYLALKFRVCKAPSNSQSLLKSFIVCRDDEGSFELRVPMGNYVKVHDIEKTSKAVA